LASPEIVIAIIGFAAASSITPGPNNLLVMTCGLNHNVGASLPLVGADPYRLYWLAAILAMVAVGSLTIGPHSAT
jgi:threonine/homoserine/homoserine lactone efflux protein